MSVIDDGNPTPKPRPKRTPRGTKRTGHRKVSPPNKVEPSWVHDLLAGVTLRALESAEIDAGELDDDLIRRIPGQEDSVEPAELLARVYAHIMWRIPGIRSVAKRLEGNDARAGFLTDLTALALALWLRNRDLIAGYRAAQNRQRADAAPEPPSRKFVFRQRNGAPSQSNNPGDVGERGAQ